MGGELGVGREVQIEKSRFSALRSSADNRAPILIFVSLCGFYPGENSDTKIGIGAPFSVGESREENRDFWGF